MSAQPEPGLRRAAVAGVKWTSGSAIAQAILGFVQVAILARILPPSAFGLVAATVVVVGIASVVTDLGLNGAIIAHRTRDRAVLSSLYWTTVIAGAVVALAVAVAAPTIAAAFGQPALTELVRFAAIGFVVVPLGQQFQILLQRDLQFKAIARIEIAATCLGFIVAVATAAAGAGALALIWGTLGAAASKSLALAYRVWREWRPMLHLRLADLRGFRSWGLFQVGERATNYLGQNVDYLLIGAYLGPEALGAYFIAYQLCVKPMLLINPPLTRVAFPVFARRSDDDETLARGFLEVSRLIALIACPVLVATAVAAPDLVPVVFGDRWESSVPLIQLLAGVGIIKAVSNPVGSLLLAKRRPDIGFKYTLAAALVLAGLLRVAVEYGVTAVAAAFLGFGVVTMALWPLLIRRVVGLSVRRYAGALLVPLGYGVAAGAAMEVPLTALRGLGHLTALAAAAAAGTAVLGAFLYARERVYIAEILRVLMGRGIGARAAPLPTSTPAAPGVRGA